MFRNMAIALFTHGQITTTVPKAKAVRPFVEKLISAAKKGDLASRRRVIAKLGGDKWMINKDEDGVVRNKYGELKSAPKIAKHLFDEIAPTYADRNGGYTRIIRLGKHRIGDATDLCVLQLVSEEDTGPQLAGSRSRRAKSNKRMEYAAKLAKEMKSNDAEEEAPVEEADTAVAVADEPVEEQAEETTDENKSDE